MTDTGPSTLTIPQALLLLYKAEESGAQLLADELVILASAVENGFDNFPADIRLSHRLIDKAADAGHPQALVMKAVRMMEEAGGMETPDAIGLIEKAAALGEPESMFNAGVELISSGRDPQKGFKLIADSAERGYPNALFQLALAYRLGTFCEPNDILARFYELMALDAEAAGAPESINHFFEEGDCLTPKGDINREKIIEDACRIEHPAALHAWFCRHIEQQIDSPEANTLALSRLRKAAESGYAPAAIMLVDFINCDADEAFRWLSSPCKRNFPRAMSCVGRMIYYGESGTPDQQEGLRLINKALAFNDQEAMTFIVEATRSGQLADPTSGARPTIYTMLCRNEFAEEAARLMADDTTD